MEPWILFVTVAAVVGTVFFLHQWRENQYAAAWQQSAQELGLSYHGPKNDLLARFTRLATLQRGRKQRVVNAIVANDGDLEIVLADFRFVTGTGKSARRHTETLCILHSPALALSSCTLRPQLRLLDYLGKLFGGQDIDFAEDPEFSRAFVLQAQSPEAVRRLFDESTRAWFMERKAKQLHFEANRDALVFHYARKLKPDQARDLIAQALQIRKLLACSASA